MWTKNRDVFLSTFVQKRRRIEIFVCPEKQGLGTCLLFEKDEPQ